jgi:hypothetical protein
MTSAAKPWPHTVIYDPEAVVELLAMKSREEHRALLNAVRKLGELGEQLGPPHMKPLKGDRSAALRELRPRQGQAIGVRSTAEPATSTRSSPSIGTRTSPR